MLSCMKGLKVKIDRALIIRREQVALSMEYADMCAASCEKFGLPYEFMKAVEFLPCEEAFKSVGAKKSPTYTNTMGNCNCHSSHIKCWKRIIEIDKPCLILEHDAIVKGDPRTVDIPDMAVVTFGHRVAMLDEYEPPRPADKLVQINRSVGVHACALTPKTATWLWENARDKGVHVGVDRWLMMRRQSGLPLYVPDPPQVVCWARISTSNFRECDKEKFAKEDAIRRQHRSQVCNYKESYTEGWKEGCTKEEVKRPSPRRRD